MNAIMIAYVALLEGRGHKIERVSAPGCSVNAFCWRCQTHYELDQLLAAIEIEASIDASDCQGAPQCRAAGEEG